MALTRMIQTLVGEEDWESIHRVIKQEDRTLSGYIRRLVREDLRQRGLSVTESDEEVVIADGQAQ